MSALDEEIIKEFVTSLRDKSVLSEKGCSEVNEMFIKTRITSEDWSLLIDKEYIREEKGGEDGN